MKKVVLIFNILLVIILNACNIKYMTENKMPITNTITNEFDIYDNKIIYDKDNLIIKYLKQIDNGISVQVINNTTSIKIIYFHIYVDSYFNMDNESDDIYSSIQGKGIRYEFDPNESRNINFQLRYPFIDKEYKNKYPIGDWELIYYIYTQEEKKMKFYDFEYIRYNYLYVDSNSTLIPNKNHNIEIKVDKKIFEDDEVSINLLDNFGFNGSAVILVENKTEKPFKIFSNEIIQLNGEDAEYDIYDSGEYAGTWVADSFNVFVPSKKKAIYSIFVGDMGGTNTNIGLKNIKIAKYDSNDDAYRDNKIEKYNLEEDNYENELETRDIGNLQFWVDDNHTKNNLRYWVESVLEKKNQFIKFGDYYNVDKSTLRSIGHLDWKLIKTDSDNALLMYDGFFDCPYLDNNGNICLDDAIDWLNDDFYNNTFTKTEKHLIIRKEINKLFCLSSEQLRSQYNYNDCSEKIKYYPVMWVKYK